LTAYLVLIDKLLLQIAILAEICLKMRFFKEKLQKSPSAEGFAPKPPCFRRLGDLLLPPPHPLRIPGYATVSENTLHFEKHMLTFLYLIIILEPK